MTCIRGRALACERFYPEQDLVGLKGGGGLKLGAPGGTALQCNPSGRWLSRLCKKLQADLCLSLQPRFSLRLFSFA